MTYNGNELWKQLKWHPLSLSHVPLIRMNDEQRTIDCRDLLLRVLTWSKIIVSEFISTSLELKKSVAIGRLFENSAEILSTLRNEWTLLWFREDWKPNDCWYFFNGRSGRICVLIVSKLIDLQSERSRFKDTSNILSFGEKTVPNKCLQQRFLKDYADVYVTDVQLLFWTLPCHVVFVHQSIVGGKSLAELLLNGTKSSRRVYSAATRSSTSGNGRSLEDIRSSARGVALLKVLCTAPPTDLLLGFVQCVWTQLINELFNWLSPQLQLMNLRTV